MKTRWSTLVEMLKRFVRLSGPIRKALDDKSINKRNLFPDDDYDMIHELLKALVIVQAATDLLQGNDVNLATADEVRGFCMKL